ncbi:ParB/RepB/Spo0J family partition protein [Rivularia sp. UHCC 0363]|uniref:ParB/RepB/Spo0J family partition protein n=1 Tax=Rivularia sp. UHCC 0363 TaxID=3110244 RepID=UPI002B2178B7|nr:ParB/RepB/Spo0J family partition protein [Rivularia sp. UHCC 0363]MEA5598716.1 ParB/RepB/Spo0J family partition protein [Rivularia sp. UHCC 0363]
MTNKKRNEPYTAIKKPVDLLFGNSAAPSMPENQPSPNTIPLTQIKLPISQPRRYFDPQKLAELSHSIKELGILEPLLVRPLPKNIYELVAGERRFKASQMAGLTEVPVIVREMDDIITHQVRLVENLQREDLNPLEETEGILELLVMRLELSQDEVISYLNRMRNVCDRHKDEDSEVRHNVMSQGETQVIEELFASLGKMGWDSFVKNRLPLFKLPPSVLEVLRQGKLEYTKARAIAKVKDEQKRQDLIEVAIAQNLSLTQINERVKAANQIAAPAHPLKERYKIALPRLQKSKVWDNPKKQKALEKLLAQIDALIEE